MSAKTNKGNKPASTTPKAAAKKTTPKTPKVEAPKPTLDNERVLWVLENARPALAPCLCGCGKVTKGRFFPGCDAKLKAWLKNDATNPNAQEALGRFGW